MGRFLYYQIRKIWLGKERISCLQHAIINLDAAISSASLRLQLIDYFHHAIHR